MNAYATLWTLHDPPAGELTPHQARDLILECFFHAQKETFAHLKEQTSGTHPDDRTLRRMVTGGVKAVFHELQCNFEQPTREELQQVVDELANKSAAWGTPRSIILHHHTQIQRLLAQLQ